MSQLSRLTAVRRKIERADCHIHDLEDVVTDFAQSRPYTLLRDEDPQTGHTRLYVSAIESPAPAISLAAGDALHNLRSALDHLAYQLVVANGGTPSNSTSFPIVVDTPNADSRKRLDRQVAGMAGGAETLIRSLQPYQTPNPELRALQHLNNIDKHRLLLIVGCGIYRAGFDYRNTEHPLFNHPAVQSLLRKMDENQGPLLANPALMRVVIAEGQTELASLSWPDGPPPNAEENLELAYEVVFAEPGFVYGWPVVGTLQNISQTVAVTVTSFDQYL